MDKDQRAHLKVIIGECKRRYAGKGKHPFRTAVITTMTAMTEANLYVYASANVPESQKYPHQRVIWESDGLGHDHASMGMYQQQTGTKWANAGTTTMGSPDGWGSPKELMDPLTSTRKFLNQLERTLPSWWTYDPGYACQRVQGSAFPDRYNTQRARAHRAVLTHWALVRNPAKKKVSK